MEASSFEEGSVASTDWDACCNVGVLAEFRIDHGNHNLLPQTDDHALRQGPDDTDARDAGHLSAISTYSTCMCSTTSTSMQDEQAKEAFVGSLRHGADDTDAGDVEHLSAISTYGTCMCSTISISTQDEQANDVSVGSLRDGPDDTDAGDVERSSAISTICTCMCSTTSISTPHAQATDVSVGSHCCFNLDPLDLDSDGGDDSSNDGGDGGDDLVSVFACDWN